MRGHGEGKLTVEKCQGVQRSGGDGTGGGADGGVRAVEGIEQWLCAAEGPHAVDGAAVDVCIVGVFGVIVHGVEFVLHVEVFERGAAGFRIENSGGEEHGVAEFLGGESAAVHAGVEGGGGGADGGLTPGGGGQDEAVQLFQ